MTNCFRIFPNLAQNYPMREDDKSKDGRRGAKWTKSGVVDGSGVWASIIQHQKKNDTNIFGSEENYAHIFNSKLIGKLHDLEECINPTN